MPQISVSEDLYWTELDKQLKEKQFKVSNKAKNINNLVEEVIKDYKAIKDVEKSAKLMQKLERAIEVLFDNLITSLDENDHASLTELCRRFNEDIDLQELREAIMHVKVAKNENKQNAFLSSLDATSIATPRKATYPKLVQAKILEDTFLYTQEDFGATNEINLAEREINIEALLDKSEIDNDHNQVEENNIQKEEETINLRNYNEELLQLLEKMEEGVVENKIDQAYEYYNKIMNFNEVNNLQGEHLNYFNTKIEEFKQMLEDVKRSYNDCNVILKEIEDEEGYITESSKKNLSIKYKAPSGQPISVKMEGELDVPLFNMVALMYEMEGYSEWMPFCKTVQETKKISKTSKAGYLRFSIPPPLSDREAYVYGAGFDRLDVNGSVFVAAKSVHDNDDLIKRFNLDIPGQTKATRLDIPYMGASFYPLGRNKIRFSIVTKFDLKMRFLPVSVINWFVRKASSFLIEKIMKKASNLQGSMWEKKIQENREFYGWMETKLEAYLLKQEETKL